MEHPSSSRGTPGATLRRLMKFGLVGTSGVVVNEAVTGLALLLLAGLTSPVLQTNAAVFAGWLVSAMSNFLLNYYWTWRDRFDLAEGSIRRRAVKYYLTASVAFFIQVFTVNLLAAAFGWGIAKVLAWNLVGIAAGMVINFVLADRWVFNSRGRTPYGLLAVLLVLILTGLKLLYIQDIALMADEAYYWEWSRWLAWSYFDHPPMVAYLISISTGVLGATPTAVRLGGILLSGGAALLLYDLGRRMFAPRIALVAVALVNTTLLYFVGTMIMTPDIPQIFFWALAMNLTWRALHSQELFPWALAGVAAGMALLSKYVAIFIIPSFFLYLIAARDEHRWLRHPGPYLMALCAFLVFLPVIVWNQQHQWISFAFQLGHGSGAGEELTLRWLARFLGGQAALVSPILFVALLAALVRGFYQGRQAGGKEALFLACFTGPLLLFMLLVSLQSRVEANWPTPAYLAGFLLLALRYGRAWGSKGYGAIGATVAVAFSLMITATALVQMRLPILPLDHKQNPAARSVGWERLAERVQAHRSQPETPLTVVTDRYQYSSLLAFHLPDQPRTFVLAPHRRSSQYDLWGGYEPRQGQEILYVTNQPALAPEAAATFARIQLLERVDITWRGERLRSLYIFLCKAL